MLGEETDWQAVDELERRIDQRIMIMGPNLIPSEVLAETRELQRLRNGDGFEYYPFKRGSIIEYECTCGKIIDGITPHYHR